MGISRNGPLTGDDLLHEHGGYDSASMRSSPPLPGADGGMFGPLKPKGVRFGHLDNVAESEQRDSERVLAPGESMRRLQAMLAGQQPMDAQDAFGLDPSGEAFGDDPQSLVDAEFGDMVRQDDGAMGESQLLAYLEMEERDAVDFIGSTIAQERADALDYYFGQPFGNEEEGRSEVMSTDVLDVVEGMLPGILKPFVSTDDVCKFTPFGPKDRKAAEQETAYLNHVMMQKNDGFGLLRKWVWDGLTQKNGIVHYYWDDTHDVQIERYKGLTDMGLTLIQQQSDCEITQHNEYPDPYAAAAAQMAPQSMPAAQAMQGPAFAPPAPPPPMLHDVTVRYRHGYGCARVENVPPEEFLISRDAVDVNPHKARFVERRRYMTLSRVRQLLPDAHIPDDLADYDAAHLQGSPEFMARRSDDPMLNIMGSTDPASRPVMVRDMYPMIDFDGDGIAERRRILVIGRQIFINEEVEEPPFAAWTPYIIPHRFFGLCPADLTMDTQLIKSTIKRQVMDNFYTINNNRVAVSDRVDLDDLLSNSIGGAVRVATKGQPISNDILPLPVQPIGQIAQPLIEYIDQENENRNGYNRFAAVTDADALKTSPTATQVTQQGDSGRARQEMIARTFAETGLVPLLVGLHGLIRRNATHQDTFELMGEWVDVDPRIWVTRRHMTVSVGLGTGDKAQQMQSLQMIGMAQEKLVAVGLCGPQEMFNTATKLAQAAGEKDASQFFTAPQIDPKTGKAQMPPPPPTAVDIQAKANEGLVQAEQAKAAGALARQQQADAAALNQKLLELGWEAMMQLGDQRHEERMAVLKNMADMRTALGMKHVDAQLAPAHAQAQAAARPNVVPMARRGLQ